MKISNTLKAGFAAVALVSSTAMPAAAHGPIQFTEIYYMWDYSDWANPVRVPVGEYRLYCDGHSKSVGTQTGDSEIFYGDGC